MAVLLMMSAMCIPAHASADVFKPNLKVGNFWEYSFDMSEDWMNLEGTVKMMIDEVDETFVDNVIEDVFIVRSEGHGDIYGLYEGMEVTGAVEFGARETRLCSNFSITHSVAWMNMSVTYLSITMTTRMGYDIRFSPVVDDYIGDDDLTDGTEVTGTTHVIGDYWVEFLGSTEHEILDEDVEHSMAVTNTNVTKYTVAGSYPCSVVRFTAYQDGEYSTGYNYYSEQVGNYVFMDAESAHYNGMLGELSLVSFSYNPDGVAPEADAGEDITVKVGETFTLDGTGSTDNVGIVNYSWEFLVDGEVEMLYGPQPTFSIDTKGVYEVNLTVYDEAGNEDVDSVTVTVEDEGVLVYITGEKMWVGLTAIAVIAAIALLLGLLMRRRRATPATLPPTDVVVVPPAVPEPSPSSAPQPQAPSPGGPGFPQP